MNTKPSAPSRPPAQDMQLQTHFAVYEDLTLVDNLVFAKARITIGSSRQADLILDHHTVEAFHAEVYHRDRQVFLTNRFPQNGLQLNGRSVGLVELQQDDVIEIGPFSLRIDITEIYEDEIDADEEDIWEAPFSLQSELKAAGLSPDRESPLPRRLQVVKTIGEAVVDVRDLEGREKYVIDTGSGRIRLVDAGRKGQRFVALLPGFSGYLQSPSGEVTADLDGYRKPEYLKHKKRGLYRIPLPAHQSMVIDTPGGSYRIAWVQPHPTPDVAAPARPSDFSWRHWASSAGIHLLLLAGLSLAMLFHASTPTPPKPHFVEIDPAMLEKLKSPQAPPAPEPPTVAKQPDPPAPEPAQPEPPPKKVAKKRPVKKKAARAKPVSRHAKAGGGHGKGNIKNRNVKQAGLLSMIGGPTAGGPSSALVAVTNLDAVPVPGATEKAFSVGGLKGALGSGTIAVAADAAIMQTKGSQQVLRSAGATGSGDVAALERGTTGKKKVQAMVTVKMNRTVKVKGGMSREMVKRVIDRHLEEITYCYETSLMNDPSILGRIVFEWKILMNGRVGEIRIVASSVNSHDLHACIKSAIRAWQFPKPTGSEVVVSYPFVFDLVSF